MGIPLEENATIALENLMAEGKGGVADVSRALKPYKLAGEGVRELLKQTFAKAVVHCLADDRLDQEEQQFLLQLRRRLDLSDAEVMAVEASAIHPRYQKALTEVLADGHISEKERQALATLQENLRLPKDVRDRLYATLAGGVLQDTLDKALSDRRLSPAEEADFKAMSDNLGIDPTMSVGSLAIMDRFRLLWRIENGDIPPVSVDLHLHKDELCYFQAPTRWHELRSVTRRVSYAGPTASIPILKGVRFRMGTFAPSVERSNELTHVDSGTLYITNKRVLFDGAASNRTVRLNKVVSYQVFSDAIVLEKDTGRSPYLFIEGDIEMAAVILSAVLERS